MALCSPQIFSAAASELDPESKEDLAAPAPMSQEQFIGTLMAEIQVYPKYRDEMVLDLKQVKPEHYQAFVHTFNALSMGMNGKDKADVINDFAHVKPEHYQVFTSAVDVLSAGMNGSDKTAVISTLVYVKPEKYQVFTTAIDALSAGMNGSDKANAIMDLAQTKEYYQALAKPENYQVFTTAIDALSAGMNDAEAKEDSAAPAPMSQEQFIGTLMAEIQVSPKYKDEMVLDLKQVKPENYQTIIHTVNVWSAGMDVNGSAKLHH